MVDNPSAKKTCPCPMFYQRPYQLTSAAITWLTPGKGQNFDHDNQNNDTQLGICMHRGFGFTVIKHININIHVEFAFTRNNVEMSNVCNKQHKHPR